MSAFTTFATRFGQCGIVWRGDAVVMTRLPDGDGGAAAMAAWLARKTGASVGEPPPVIAGVIDAITRSLAGEAVPMDSVLCAPDGTEAFERRVHTIVRGIARGQTMTYGAVAQVMGDKHLARAVGRAMARNPLPIIVPCHRVVGSGGRMVGFSAGGGVATKMRILAGEDVHLDGGPGLFDDLPLAVRHDG